MKKFISFDESEFEVGKVIYFKSVIVKTRYENIYVLAVEKCDGSALKLCHGDLDYVTEQMKRLYTEEADVIEFKPQPKIEKFINEKINEQDDTLSWIKEILRILEEENAE